MYIAYKSFTTQLLEYIEEITQALDEGQDVNIIYLDFQKAFDRIPHKRHLVKLFAYGIRCPVMTWIKAFLTNRKQRVTTDGEKI